MTANWRSASSECEYPQVAPYAAPVPLLQPSAAGLRGNLRNCTPGSAGNEARHTDIPRRLRIRARHNWNPSLTDVIVNT
jgi:hypothetical protein